MRGLESRQPVKIFETQTSRRLDPKPLRQELVVRASARNVEKFVENITGCRDSETSVVCYAACNV